MAEGKQHLSIVICGHVDSGKSTTTGRLIFELGGIPERELEKLKEEAAALGKSSFAFAFYMDRQKEERERGVTISCTTKEFFTNNWHYTIIDAPGERALQPRCAARCLLPPQAPPARLCCPPGPPQCHRLQRHRSGQRRGAAPGGRSSWAGHSSRHRRTPSLIAGARLPRRGAAAQRAAAAAWQERRRCSIRALRPGRGRGARAIINPSPTTRG
jgi:hypothetical protein